ncbi:Zn-dependent alcohol dehydrogenase [Rhodobacteraceae bacterium NNCM2]|nr:Zn-dependent alcohol dehydrogenase [Coraliihabitans acroporae]
MRAAVCHEYGKPLKIEEVEIAEPGPTQVKVRIQACAICHSDIHFADGAWGGKMPAVYGHEASGIVEVVGEQVTNVKPGDRVAVTLVNCCGDCPCCNKGFYSDCEKPDYHGTPLSFPDGGFLQQAMKTGAFAEEVVVHYSQVCAVDEDIPFEVAALMACGGITGFGAVVNSVEIRPGDDAVVIGCGGVGLNAVQGASLIGIRRLIAVDLAEDRLDAALAFGATHKVNGRSNDAVGQVKEITGGRGVDYVFVTVGAIPAMEQGIEMLSKGGSLVIVGMPAAGEELAFQPLLLADASQRIIGSHMGHSDIRRDIPWLCQLYRSGRIKMDELITGRYPFDEINDAIEATRAGKGLRNVVIFGES